MLCCVVSLSIFFSLFVFWLALTGSSKYVATRKNTLQYYTLHKRLIRYEFFSSSNGTRVASQFTNLSFFSVVCSPLRLNLLNPQCLTPKRWADEKRKQFLSTRSLENELVRHSWTLALSEAVVKKKIKSDHSFVACSSHVELRLIANRSEGFRSFCSSVWQRQVLSFARVNEIFLTNRSEHFFP